MNDVTKNGFVDLSDDEMLAVDGGSALVIAWTIFSWTVFFCSLPTTVS